MASRGRGIDPEGADPSLRAGALTAICTTPAGNSGPVQYARVGAAATGARRRTVIFTQSLRFRLRSILNLPARLPTP